jgi:hypothetical protein
MLQNSYYLSIFLPPASCFQLHPTSIMFKALTLGNLNSMLEAAAKRTTETCTEFKQTFPDHSPKEVGLTDGFMVEAKKWVDQNGFAGSVRMVCTLMLL